MGDRYPSDWDSRRKKVYRRDQYTCQNCGAKGGPSGGTELHAHHNVPISNGGSHRVSNLTTLCKGCHDAIHHKNKMAPTASQPVSNNQGPDIGEIISVEGFVKMLLWMWLFAILAVITSPFVIFVYPIVWFILRYYFDPFGFQDRNTAIGVKSSKDSESKSSTEPITTALKNPHSSRKTRRNPSKYGKDESDNTDYDSSDDNRVDGYNPDKDPYHWDETLRSDADTELSQDAKLDELDASNTTVEGGDGPDVSFDWYGDAEVPVETVLDHLDVNLDPQEREWIKQSVEKHREQGELVDAADIRWVAEASEELDLEGDHPFGA